MMDKPLDPNIPLQAFAVLGEYHAQLERILRVVHLDHDTTCCGNLLYVKKLICEIVTEISFFLDRTSRVEHVPMCS